MFQHRNHPSTDADAAEATATIVRNRRGWRRTVAAVGAMIVAAVLFASVSPADASTVPVTFAPGSVTVTNIPGYYCNVGYEFPSNVIHYRGTAELFSEVAIYHGNTQVNYGWVTATTFFSSGNQLTSIYWDNNRPLTNYEFTVKPGYQYTLTYADYWLINGQWVDADAGRLVNVNCF